MNLAQLNSAPPENREFYREAVRHLSQILCSSLTRENAEVLGHVLHIYEIRFVDGFVINGDDNFSMMGRSDAAYVLAALCDSVDKNWEWWRTQISPSTMHSHEFNERLELILGRLLTHVSVAAIAK